MDQLTESMPLVADRMLLELANGITLGRDMGTRRGGFFVRLKEGLTGQRQAGTDIAIAGLARAEQALLAWTTEMSARSALSNLALARTMRHVSDTRRMLTEAHGTVSRLDADLRQLADVVSETIEHFDRRLSDLEHRHQRTEIRIAAMEAFETSVGAWAAGRTYASVPWPFQVALLARELASGPCGVLEYVTGDVGYRRRLIDRVLAQLRSTGVAGGPRTVSGILEDGLDRLPAPDDRLMVAELLDSGLDGRLALPRRMLTAVMVTTLELATLTAAARPARPAAAAIELTRRRVGPLDGTTDPDSLVTRLVVEQADACAEQRLALRAATPAADVA